MQASLLYPLPRRRISQTWARVILGLLISVGAVALLLHSVSLEGALAVLEQTPDGDTVAAARAFAATTEQRKTIQ